MRYAAFLRNVNLGRPGSPTRAQLEAAFLDAGAREAASFQVNGTLVFTPGPGTRPRALAARACELMRASCGMREPVFVRSVAELRALVASEPFFEMRVSGLESCASGASAKGELGTRNFQDLTPASICCCITFLAAPRKPLPPLPIVTPRGDLELLRSDDTHVLSVSRWVGKSGGSPNAWLERQLGEPATTRNWRTVVRLVEKYGREEGIFC